MLAAVGTRVRSKLLIYSAIFDRRGHHQRPLEEAVHANVTQWPRSWDGKNPFSGGRHFSALDAPERVWFFMP